MAGKYKSYADMVKAAKLTAKNKEDEKKKLKKLRDAQFGGIVPTGEKVTVTNKNNEYVPKKNNKVDSSLQEVVKRKKAKAAKDKADATRKSTREQQSKVTTTKKKNTVKKIIEKKPEPKPIPKGLRESIAKDKKKPTVSKTTSSKTKASASNTKDFEKTKRIQQRLKDLGADIKVDGIMGAKTRAAMAKDKAKPKKVSEMTTKEVKERGTYSLKSGGKGTYEQRQNEIRREKETDKIKKTLKMKK